MILAAELAGVSVTAGRVVVVVFLALTVALGGGLTGQWMLGQLRPGAYRPGYLLPTVAGGLVGAYAAAAVHLPAAAAAAFGIGLVCCWAHPQCHLDGRPDHLARALAYFAAATTPWRASPRPLTRKSRDG